MNDLKLAFDFDLKNLTHPKSKAEGKEARREYMIKIKFDKILCERIQNFSDLIGKEIERGYQYRYVTSRSFNAIVAIQYLIPRYELTEVYMAVYRMNLVSVNKLKEIIDTGDIECGILLSSFFRENKRYERWAEEIHQYGQNKRNVRVGYAVNHAKVFLAHTKCGKHIVFEGSGNLSDNARIEQYLLEDNEISYRFHRQWINEELNKKPKANKNAN